MGLSRGRPGCSSPQLRIPKRNPVGGVRQRGLFLVRKMGLEPTRHRHTHLKRACLPIPALPQIAFDCKKDSSTFGGIKSSPILQLFPAWGGTCQKSASIFMHSAKVGQNCMRTIDDLFCCALSHPTKHCYLLDIIVQKNILYTSRKQQYGGLSVLHGIRLYLIFVQEDTV